MAHRGHMAFAVVGDELMVRSGPEQHERAAAPPMDLTDRAMTFVGSLPAKKAKARR